MSGIVRIGTVSSINYDEATVCVTLEDKDDIVTDNLPILYHEYEMPEVGEKVLCVFLGNSVSKGFCVGRYYYDGEKPAEHGENIYFKRLLKDATIKYDSATKTYTITSDNLVFNGNVTIKGNLTVNGETEITGDCTIGGISFLGHTHPDPQGGSVSPPS